jgi:hypothetical protein
MAKGNRQKAEDRPELIRGQKAEGRRFISSTWSQEPLKKILTFRATAIDAKTFF